MEILIWIIIMVVIVNNAKKKQRQAQNRNNYQTRQQQTYQRNAAQPQYQQMTLDMTQMQAAMTAKQQELKSRLQQKYPVQQQKPVQQQRPVQQTRPAQQQRPVQQTRPAQQQRPAQRPAAQGDILSRAAANTSEHGVDELELRTSDATLNCVGDIHNATCIANTAEESCLMKELNDLMLMGYRADLSFERDFLSEGIDMLNSYEIPGI